MSQSMTDELTAEQQAQAIQISIYLHRQADQLADAAEQLEHQASAAYAEAAAIEAQANQMYTRSEHLHQQADKALEAGGNG